MRSLSALLILTHLAPTFAPVCAFAAEPAAATATAPSAIDPVILKREGELKTYFEGCNNHISDTLAKMSLQRDAGDRPTPIRMMGIGIENDASGLVPFTSEQQTEMRDDVGVRRLLTGVYIQGLMNTETAWIRMMIQYYDSKIDPAYVTAKICSLGAGCTPKARQLVANVAESAVAEARTQPRYSMESAAAVINTGVKRLNAELGVLKFKPRYAFSDTAAGLARVFKGKAPELNLGLQETPTPSKLARYTQAYYDLTSPEQESPMRLLAVPTILKAVGRLQTPEKNRGIEDVLMEYVDARDGRRYPATWSTGYGVQVRNHRLPGDGLIQLTEPYALMTPHPYVSADEVQQAVAEGIDLLQELIVDLNNSVSPQATKTHEAIQKGLVSVIGGTSLAAHEVLLTFPDLAPSACRAYKDFAIEHAQTHKSDRYKKNALLATGVVVAAIGVVVHVMEAPAYAILTAALGDGVLDAISLGVGGFLIYKSQQNVGVTTRKLNLNVAAVLAGNESPEIIITRIPEQIDAASAARTDLYMNIGFFFLSTYFAVTDAIVMVDAGRAGKLFHPVVDAAAASGLVKTLAIGSGKIAFNVSKFTPVLRKAMSYWDFKDLQGTVIVYEEDPGSNIKTKARADLFDDKRGYVKLTVLERTAPSGRSLASSVKTINMPIEEFRSVIRGTR